MMVRTRSWRSGWKMAVEVGNRRLQCKYCSRKYKTSGSWFMRHFMNKHPGERIACSVVRVAEE